MAGNTKLMGMSADNTINLSRWGKKVRVGVTKESMLNIRSALADLPAHPPEQHNDGSGFKVRYDESVGRVLVDMDPIVAQEVAEIIEADAGGFASGSKSKNTLLQWVHSLKSACKAHKDYHNIEGEPDA